MKYAHRVIEDKLDEGADTDEVLTALQDEGWHLVHGPVLQRWRDQNMHEVFSYIGCVDNISIVSKEMVSDRAIAHMPPEGIRSVLRHLKYKYAEQLIQTLEKARDDTPAHT